MEDGTTVEVLFRRQSVNAKEDSNCVRMERVDQLMQYALNSL